MILKLVTLSKGFYNPGKWYISFGHYNRDEFERLVWTGDSESCELTEDELYEILKPRLILEHRVLERG